MLIKKTLYFSLFILIMTACESNNTNQSQQIGSATGAVIGGVLGGKIGKGDGKKLGVGIGAIFSSLMGKIIGRKISELDLKKSSQTAEEALEKTVKGDTNTWSNPNSQNSGSITPTTDRFTKNGMVCRDFKSTILVSGHSEKFNGRACRQKDGSWKIIN